MAAALLGVGNQARAIERNQTSDCPECEEKPSALKRVWTGLCVDFKRNNLWPQPWIGPERASVYAPMTVMVAKGWMRQNLLCEEHFEPHSEELNEAGRMKVEEIITVTPPAYRAVYIPRASTPELTAKRIEYVQQYVVDKAIDDSPVQVVQSKMRPNPYAGDYVDQIDRAFRESTPEPRIPAGMNSTGGTSQSGGN